MDILISTATSLCMVALAVVTYVLGRHDGGRAAWRDFDSAVSDALAVARTVGERPPEGETVHLFTGSRSGTEPPSAPEWPR